MSAPVRSNHDRRRLYRTGWLIAVFAICSYLLIAFAEQGSAGAGLQAVPDDPLPFNRHAGIGIDLSSYSSLAAVEWLEQVDAGPASLVLLPVDGDIVGAFNNPDTFVAARGAVEQLLNSANGAQVGLCLNRPIAAIDEVILAEAAVTALVENFTDRVTYIGTCGLETSSAWQESVLDLLDYDPPSSSSEVLLAPASIGAPIRLQAPVTVQAMSPEYLDSVTGTSYAGLRMAGVPLIDDETRETLRSILHDRAHVATLVAAPAAEADPVTFFNSLALGEAAYNELSEGFNNVALSRIAWHGDWTTTEVGPVSYQRTAETGSWMTAEFIGTEIWAVGIVSPDGGRLGVWIDADDASTSGEPDVVVSLESTQAEDAAVLLMDGLPAARHSITIVAADGDVALSGIFVTGRAEGGWHGTLGAVGMLLAAMGGLGVVLVATVDDLRARIGLDRENSDDGLHPRVFRRDH